MQKVNVFQNRAAVAKPQTYVFKDPETGQEYAFSLRALNEVELDAAEEFGEKLIRRYMVGGFTDPTGDFRQAPEILASYTDEEEAEHFVEVSEKLCYLLAELERMQGIKRDIFDDTPRDNAYGAKEIAVIAATSPSVWNDLKRTRREIRARSGKKKASLAGSDGISPMPDSEAETAT